MEVPGNAADPNVDLFAQKNEAKKERVAKNEYQRLRNIAASRKIKVPAVGLPPLEGTLHSNQVCFLYFTDIYIFNQFFHTVEPRLSGVMVVRGSHR